jgi:hypothetical protein
MVVWHTHMLSLVKLIYLLLIEVGSIETYICTMVKHFLIEDVEDLCVDLSGYFFF